MCQSRRDNDPPWRHETAEAAGKKRAADQRRWREGLNPLKKW